jgi:aprataxin
VHALILDVPAKVCIQRALQRTSHEGGLQGKVAPSAIHRMAKSFEKPSEAEGFSSIFSCNSDDKIDKAFSFYRQFSGTGEQGKFYISLMDVPLKVEQHAKASEQDAINLNDGSRTLAFPSISTADFQFDHEKASEIIVETACDFLLKTKKRGLKLVLVDLKEDSDMLTRVRQKALIQGLGKEDFLTVAGDITRLYSSCRLKCNFIANATNWSINFVFLYYLYSLANISSSNIC